MSEFRHCDFRHLLTRVTVDVGFGPVDYYGHVHEGEAMFCAYMERLGW